MISYNSIMTLPKCAMFYNGEFIEEDLLWYRTLEVKGREDAEFDIQALERIGDGAIFQSRREKARTLKVKFVVGAENTPELKAQLDRLNYLTHKEQVNIIFYDEPDRFYTGTKASLSFDHVTGDMAVGTLELYCPDPHKYSIAEYEVTANAYGEIAVDYDGTYKSYPTFIATCASELGYISYIDTDEHVIQIGDPDEEDVVEEDKKTVLIEESFTGSGSPTGWTTNAATLEDEVASYQQTGTVTESDDGLVADTYSTAITNNRHGPSITKTITPSKNFDLTFDLKMHGTSVKQIQEVMVICTGTVDNVKTAICSMHITHSTDGSYKSSVYAYILGDKKAQYIWTAEEGNKTFGNYGQCRIRKEGNGFTFVVGSTTVTALKSVGTEDYEISEVSIFFDKKNQLPHMRSAVGSICAIKNFKVVNFGSTWVDVPNKFSDGDVIEADCNSGKIIVNGAEQYGLGALGNDWERFYLTYGVNAIKCVYSDWAVTPPTFKMKYRKVYL